MVVLLSTETNIAVVPAEAIINIAACQRYHGCCYPQKLSWMLSLDKAIIDAASYESYHQCRCRLKLAIAIMVLLPTEANMDVIPAEASIDTATRGRYHGCHRP